MSIPPCEACRAFQQNVEVPAGLGRHGSARVCWICAHLMAVHEATFETIGEVECQCTPVDIYPRETWSPLQAKLYAKYVRSNPRGKKR